MTEALNAGCFAQPHWLVIARGFDTERWFEDYQAIGTGGILMPRETHLRVGNRYYRFASSTSLRPAQVGGGWWIDHENFRIIENFAQEHGYSLSEAARLFLALPYAWTRVDRLVHSILAVPLKAYVGLGKPAELTNVESRGQKTSWIPLQHQRVQQLYIPGLYIRGSKPRTQLYEQAFRQPTFEYIHGNRRPV